MFTAILALAIVITIPVVAITTVNYIGRTFFGAGSDSSY
jgi:hypothetical protein